MNGGAEPVRASAHDQQAWDKMDKAMPDTDGQPANPATGDAAIAAAPDLVTAAHRPGVDPCDVACAALPALIVGDLAPRETAWLADHTADCRDCATERDRYEHVGTALDRMFSSTTDLAPPSCSMPRRPVAHCTRVDSPVGPLLVAASDAGVCEIDFAINETESTFRQHLTQRGFAPRSANPTQETDSTLSRVTTQLREYFAGARNEFDLPVDLSGLTPFQQSVLEATADVPFGRLDTYQGIASRIGKPRATRAVGNALGRNPIPVVVPCHRIVRSDHSIGGYTGGLPIKQHLLALEGTQLI